MDSLECTTFWEYALVSSFPRKTFGPELLGSSLEELQLVPQAALFVQPGDNDE